MPEWLQRKVGPYTVGVWLLVIAGGLVLAYAFRRFSGGSSGDDDAAAIPASMVGQEPTGIQGGVRYSADGSADTPTPGVKPVTTNSEWLRVSSAKLQEAGWSAGLVDTALRRYLSGYTLTDDQYRVVDAALTSAGPPPDGAPAITREPVPSSDVPGSAEDTAPTAPTSPTAPTAPADESYLQQLVPVLDDMGHPYGDSVGQGDALKAAAYARVFVGARVDEADVPRILNGWQTNRSPASGPSAPSPVQPTGPNYLQQLAPVLDAMGHPYGDVVDQGDALKAAAYTGTDVGTRVDEGDVPRILADYERKVAA